MSLPLPAWPAEQMTFRERFLATVNFGSPDRLPYWEPLGYEEATLRRWVREGLPEDMSSEQFLSLDRADAVPVCLGPMPPHRPGELPIARPGDFRGVAAHYSCYSPARYPTHWEDCKRCWAGRDYPLRIELDGPLAWLAWWLGPCAAKALTQERGFADEALDFLLTYLTLTLEKAASEVDVDYAVIREWPARPARPGLSAPHVGSAMMEQYGKLCSFFREHGIGVIVLSTPDDVGHLIPDLLAAGVSGIMPCRAGAGMDVLALAEEHPKLLIVGGLDVRQLARQRRHADREARIKIPAAVERGGWIPCFDEPIPASVPLRNYEHYWHVARELLAARQQATPRPTSS
ncbi:MAG: hypothetical protein ACE5JM_16685, partial [Armatimonadota bacterium]